MRFWTKDRCQGALSLAVLEIKGPLPCSDKAYQALQKGRRHYLPYLRRLYDDFGSLAKAWLAAGADRTRISLANHKWTPEEETYVLDYAGTKTLEEIGNHLRRSRAAVRRRLYQKGVKARDNQGFMSAAEIAQEYNCSYTRVQHLLDDGTLRGRYDAKRHRWQVDFADINPKIEALLRAPKQTHKAEPLDMGDYDRRHHLRRRMVNGKVIRYPPASLQKS